MTSHDATPDRSAPDNENDNGVSGNDDVTTGRPVDTLEAPHEPSVPPASTIGQWVLMLIGPTIWITHFAVVYLGAEAVCRAEVVDGIDAVSSDTLSVLVVVATIIAAAATALAAAFTWRRARRSEASTLLYVATMLSAGSSLAVLSVGLPVLWLAPCET